MRAWLRPRWWSGFLFLLSLLVALDFFFGGAFSFPLLRLLLPGKPSRYAGTILLVTLLAVAHALHWLGAQDGPWSVIRRVLSSWWPQYALVLIIFYAIWSRLGTLDWDIQHGPDGYEGHFIRAVKRMLMEGDLNHGYHEYPGLFLYLLLGAYLFAFVVAVGARMGTSLENIPPQHFLKMGRCLVAGFGVLNVVLTFPLGLKWFNRRVGLFAAALVAVSYLEIYTSHYIRPDIVLETFFVVALLQMLQLLERGTAKSALLAGAAVGAAIAVKYTGFLAIPALGVAVGLAPADAVSRWLRGILAGAAVIVTYALASPYTFLDLPGFLYGVAEQGLYNTDPSLQPAENMARYYTEVLARESIGYFALLLMFVGAARVLAAPRRKDLVVVAFIAPYFLFFFAAPVQFDRFLLPVQPVLAVLAGHGLEWFFERAASSRRKAAYLGAAALMGLALAPPLAKSARYVVARTMPSVRDDVRAWALTHLPRQSRIGVSRLGPSFDGTPFIEGRFVRLDGESLALLVHFDFLVSAAIDDPVALEGFREVARFEPRNAAGGHAQIVYQVPAELRPRYERIPLEATQLSSTSNPGEIPNLLDANPETGWQSGPSERAERVEIELGTRRRVGKIVLTVPDEGIEAAADLRVLASLDGRNYFNARRFVLSEAIPGAGGWIRQSILLGESDARILRLSEPRDPRGNLFLSELEIYERVP